MIALHAGRNIITDFPPGVDIITWNLSDPNMMYLREHLEQIVVTIDDDTKAIIKATSSGWSLTHITYNIRCECPGLLDLELPIYPGFNEYVWPINQSLTGLELLDKVGLLNNTVPENCLSGIWNMSTGTSLSYQFGNWVGSLVNQSISLGDNIRLVGTNGANPYECAVNLREYNPTVNETVEQCLSDSYWCRQTEDNTGVCPSAEDDLGTGCVETIQEQSIDGFDSDIQGYQFPDFAQKIEIFMDLDTYPFIVELYENTQELTTYLRGTMAYSGTTIGACGSCGSLNMGNVGFDNRAHCCANRHGGNRHYYTTTDNNGCDEEVWPAGDLAEGYNCYYPILPPDTEYCGDAICTTNQQCVQSYDVNGNLQSGCVDQGVQPFTNFMVYGRFVYNPDNGIVREVVNSQGGLGDYEEHISNYGDSFISVCRDFPVLDQPPIEEDSPDYQGIIALENPTFVWTYYYGDGTSTPLTVYDCLSNSGHTTYRDGEGDIDGAFGCPNPTACNYNPDALMDGPESMCATLPPDCNGNCEKDIYGNPNPLFGFEIDACGLCSTTEAALESPVRTNYWVDECGKCTANRKVEIARSIGQKNMTYPDPNGNIYPTFLNERIYEGTQWFYTLEPDYGNSDLYSSAFIATGDSVCAQSNSNYYHEQCVGVELQLQNGDWVLFNEFPNTGEMMSRSTLYDLPLGWGDEHISRSCPGTIDYDTYDECMRNNSNEYETYDGPTGSNIDAWNNTCCDESCTMGCMPYDSPPHWENTSFNEYTQQHFNLTGGSTPYLSNGCDINWAALLNTDNNNQIVSWNNTNYNQALYGDINGLPVKSIRAVCGELPRLPMSNSTIQNIMYTRESRPASYFIKRLSDAVTSNDYDFYNLHSEFQESMFVIIEDDLHYPGSYSGNGPDKETQIPFVHIDKAEYSQQITKIINPSTGDYVHISEDNNLITHDNQIITPDNQLDLVPWLFSNGVSYHIEVTRNESGLSFVYGVNTNNSLHIGIFGPPQILNSATNMYHKDTFGKLYCCEDSSPQNGLCDLPFNYATYCATDVGGFFNVAELAQHTFVSSCEEGQGSFIDVYEGVAGDVFGCIDQTAINYNVLATFPEDLSPCEYAKPLQVMNGQYTSYVVDHNVEQSIPNTDAGRLYRRNVSEDTGAILGDFKIVDLNYGVHNQIFNINDLTTELAQFDVYTNNTTGNFDFGPIKTFKLSDPAIQPESYTDSVYHQGRYYEAMVYTVKYEIEFEKDVFGDYTTTTGTPPYGNVYFRFQHPLYSFNTHVGIDFVVSNVDDYPTPIQYTPNMIANSDCAAPGDTSWDIWNNTDCDSNWEWYTENILPPGASINDEFREENFVANQKYSMKSTYGSENRAITHAKVYKRANSVKIPYNTQNIGIGSNASAGSTQYWQTVNLPAGEYMISGWVKYVRGQILYTQYSNGDSLNGTETTDDLIPKSNGYNSLLRLHMQTHSWPWANVHNIDLSDSIVASKEDGGWKYFETSFTYNDEHFKTSRIYMNDYSAVNDIFNPYFSWRKKCTSGANPCGYPLVTDAQRGKKRNTMVWDGTYWNKVTGERSPLRIGFRSMGSMSQENPMVFGIYGLQLNRMDDYETTRQGNTKKFLKKSGKTIILPANPYNSNEDTGLQNPNACDTSRLVKMTTAVDTGTSVSKTEEGLHDFKFDVVNELNELGELNGYEWQGANEVQMSLPSGGDFYVEYLGNGWELECIGAPNDSTLSNEVDENIGGQN